MGSLIFIVLIFWLGFWIGRKTAPQITKKDLKRKSYTFSERQRLKILYESDVDRIKEINALTAKEGAFFMALKREFIECEVIIKQKRFFIADKDGLPIAIFEFREGKIPLRAHDIEDGLPIFLYKGMMSADAIREDRQRIAGISKR